MMKIALTLFGLVGHLVTLVVGLALLRAMALDWRDARKRGMTLKQYYQSRP